MYTIPARGAEWEKVHALAKRLIDLFCSVSWRHQQFGINWPDHASFTWALLFIISLSNVHPGDCEIS